MSRWEKLAYYATTIPAGIAISMPFPPKKSLFALGVFLSFVGVLSFLWAYRRSFVFWLCFIILAAIHLALIYYVKFSMPALSDVKRGESLFILCTIALLNGTIIYFMLSMCMKVMLVAPLKKALETEPYL